MIIVSLSEKEDLTIPAVVKIFVVFSLILILNRIRLHLSLALLAGSLVLGMWMGLGLSDLGKIVFSSIISLQTLSLVMIVGLIMVMSRIMEDSGQMARLVNSFIRLSKDARTVGSVMPALIGLLPMPGGALFSAPMVEAALPKGSIGADKKTILNYWYRHIWEYWWPLYPGVILAVALLGVETWQFMVFLAPMTLAAGLGGWVFILKPMGEKTIEQDGDVTWQKMRGFLWEMTPIWLIILVVLIMSGLKGFLSMSGVSFALPAAFSIMPGLIISTLWVSVINRFSLKKIWQVSLSYKILLIIFLVITIMIFKGVMTESHAVSIVRDELMAYHIPIVLIIIMMPFISGLITGIALGFVGASFPLIIPMFQHSGFFEYMAFAGLAYTFGFMGMMLSPVHLCLLVTKDFFNTSFYDSYRYLIKNVLTVMISALIFYSILRII